MDRELEELQARKRAHDARYGKAVPADVAALERQRKALAVYGKRTAGPSRMLTVSDRRVLEKGAEREEALGRERRAMGDVDGAQWVEEAAKHKRECLRRGHLFPMESTPLRTKPITRVLSGYTAR